MDILIHDLSFDAAALHGRSAKLLLSHHANNYNDGAKRPNLIRSRLASTPFASASGFELNGLKREELVAMNSVVLHELYFSGLGGDRQGMVPAMALALEANFGSVARWREEFVATGKALRGGSGWVPLTFQPRDGTLVNTMGGRSHACAGRGEFRSWRSTCTSTLITLISARPRAPMSIPSWSTSTGLASTSGTSSIARSERAVWRVAGRRRQRRPAGRSPRQHVRASRRVDTVRPLERSSCRGRVGQDVACRQGGRRLLRLRARGQSGDGVTPACGRRASAIPSRRHSRLEDGRAVSRTQAGDLKLRLRPWSTHSPAHGPVSGVDTWTADEIL